MGEEQGLSAANLALMQSVGLVLYSLGASDISVFHDIRGLDSRTLNTLLNAARSEGLQPVSVKGEDVQIRGGSGAQERPSRRAPTDCQTSGGGK